VRPGSSRALALPLAGVILGVVYSAGAMRYSVGSLVAPGPGLFPLLAGLTMTLGSVIALFAEYRAPSVASPRPGESFRRVPMLVAALVAYALALKLVGFVAASTALTALALVILGRRGAWPVAGIAVALSAGCYLTFRLLGVPLPSGALGLG
jgi:putative tricarboxylic transport membrane protein